MVEKTSPQIEMEKFWAELGKKVEIKINDFDKLGMLMANFTMRCNQFVDEARKSRDNIKKQLQESESKNPDWRSKKPTGKQLDALRGRSIAFNKGITRGEAWDLIANNSPENTI